MATKFRVFPDNSVLDEEYWEEVDAHGPMYDDYYVIEVKDKDLELIDGDPYQWLMINGYVM
jgi:hypothetical protein